MTDTQRCNSSSFQKHTDPSTKEYEATLAMVDDVEVIIRSIEDEKTAVEERVTTRDVFARIDGLEREKVREFSYAVRGKGGGMTRSSL